VPVYRVTLAYDGTDFSGFQLQRGSGRTVQGVLEQALTRLAGGHRVAVTGSGRTDAGVHALGQVAAFELARELAPEALQRALNGMLPEDVRVLDAAPAAPGFHPRKSAVSKLYRYVLDCGGVQLPQRARYAGFCPTRLDEAGRRLVVNRDPAAVDERVRVLPRATRDLLEALSPGRTIGNLRAPLFLIHGRQDPAVPFTESLRLDAAARAAGRPVHTAIVGAVGHVEADRRAGLADLLRLWATFYAFRRTAEG